MTSSNPVSPRRFQIFNVGLPRTGTRSMAAIFSNFRSAQEFQIRESLQHILAWKMGRLDLAALRHFLHSRDAAGQLELDAAFFHQYYLPLLVEEFPRARFVVTIRDVYSWINSFTDTLVRWRRHYQVINQPVPPWQPLLGKLLFPDFDPDLFSDPDRLRADFPRIGLALARWWESSNRQILNAIPHNRRLVLRTSDISTSLGLLADYAGVPVSLLVPEQSQINIAPYRYDWTRHAAEELVGWASHSDLGELAVLFPDSKISDYVESFPNANDWDAYLQMYRDYRSDKVAW